MIMRKILLTCSTAALFFSSSGQNEFDKYGPFGSIVYNDLQTALKISKGV
jgi:hypothetical protein